MKKKGAKLKEAAMVQEQKLNDLDKIKFKVVSEELLQSAPVTMQIAYES